MSGSDSQAAQPAIAVRISALAKRYGDRDALGGVTTAILAGEAYGLVGANGAGKTTLIKCLLDLTRPDSGHVEIFGVSHRTPAARARLAYVPERFIPPHYLQCREFIDVMVTLSGARYDPERVKAAFSELELEHDVLQRPVRQLSKGMTQKLGLVACLLVERDLYVLDEPMSGLDPASRVAVKSSLHRLCREGRTLFFTSHVLTDVEELCSKVAVLDRGSMRFDGSPAELCARFGESNLERAFIKCIRSNVIEHA